MDFCASIHCIDGRIQPPLNDWLVNERKFKWIDTITEPGPCRILAEQSDLAKINAIIENVNVSIQAHDTELIAISAHHDCAANPMPREPHIKQLMSAADFLQSKFPAKTILPLYVNRHWQVEADLI